MEKERQDLQLALDSKKTQLERNKLGQFSTPINLASEILEYGISLLPKEKISFLDPAVGTGAFYSALINNFEEEKIENAVGFDIDPFYAEPSKKLWENTKLEICIKDFTLEQPTVKSNFLICNPPYVRHHHINATDKTRLFNIALNETGISISGMAGLYTYFMLLSHKWMKENAIAGWLIPSEFMDVNYGTAIKEYLLEKVTLLHIHRFNPLNTQFPDALVSSAIVWFKNTQPPPNHSALFTYGGTLLKPDISKSISSEDLRKENKWTRFPALEVRQASTIATLGDFFEIKRGLATGNNNYFILQESEIISGNLPQEVFRPILPSSRYIKGNIVEADENGNPRVEQQLFLLDTALSEEVIKELYPSLWKYLEEGKKNGVNNGYLCSNRTPWYSQEKRGPAPLVCTYMGRSLSDKHPFRFILNKSRATMTNGYLGMYPSKRLLALLEDDTNLLIKIWEKLDQISIEDLLSEGRVYGGGLHKLEPKELAKVPLPFLNELINNKDEKQPKVAFSN